MVADRSLVAVLEDGIAVARDSRGVFVWSLTEIKTEKLSFEPIEIGQLPATADKSPVKADYHSRFPNVGGILDQLRAIPPADKDLQEPINYRNQPHLQAMQNDVEGRDPVLNFMLGSGLEIRKIDEPIADVIARFDAIPPVKVEEVRLVHMSESGVTTEDSAQFTWLRKVLGRERNLGLIDVRFVEEGTSVVPVSVVFNETPFEINLKHEQAPKGRLGIFIRPFDHDRVLLRVQKIDPKVKFWNNFEHNRLIHVKRILATVCSLIFRFFLTAAEDDLYEKDAERLACLRAVKASVPLDYDLLKPGAFAFA
jgi:hypothetical protein